MTIQTTALTLRDRSTAPADPNRRKITFRSVTIGDPAGNQIVVPARASAGDPTLGGGAGGGAVLEVYNSAGSGEWFPVALPPGGWTAYDDSTTPRGYRYKSASSTGAVTRVIVKANQLRIRGGKANWGYTLDEASQGRIAVRLTLGNGLRWCADAPAKASGTPPSTASSDRVDKFVAARRTPPPAVCPPVP